jgi:hypothetical protein
VDLSSDRLLMNELGYIIIYPRDHKGCLKEIFTSNKKLRKDLSHMAYVKKLRKLLRLAKQDPVILLFSLNNTYFHH